jgi:hypothetical protein
VVVQQADSLVDQLAVQLAGHLLVRTAAVQQEVLDFDYPNFQMSVAALQDPQQAALHVALQVALADSSSQAVPWAQLIAAELESEQNQHPVNPHWK